jgi:hypothetical protein
VYLHLISSLLFDGVTVSVNRNLITDAVARQLYQNLITLPTEADVTIDHRVIGFMGDAGSKVNTPSSSVDVLKKLQSLIQQDDALNQAESAIFRVEHLQGKGYNQAVDLIHDVAPPQVTEPEGTMHLYISSPNMAALDNHTDITDIYVLQLDGAKEWLICEESQFVNENIRSKLDLCTTYNHMEMDSMDCKRFTLYPGDGFFLPRRVVHSARAADEALSAHLTFGFSNNICYEEDYVHVATSTSRELQGGTMVCNKGQGGMSCDDSCDSGTSSCDSSCDSCPCTVDQGGTGCDGHGGTSSCDAGCKVTCNLGQGGEITGSCDGLGRTAGCDTCAFRPLPTQAPTNAPM